VTVTLPSAILRTTGGDVHHLDTHRWWASATSVDLTILGGVRGPVIDIGCGPGRLVAALAERGVPALGIDVAPGALHAARNRGAAVLERSVFDPLPGQGRWATALLFDGNVGIGGDPRALLSRVGALLAPDGVAVVEVGAPGVGLRRDRVVLEVGGEQTGWFPWAWVGADVAPSLAAAAGLTVSRCLPIGDRWFTWLRRAEGGLDGSAGLR